MCCIFYRTYTFVSFKEIKLIELMKKNRNEIKEKRNENRNEIKEKKNENRNEIKEKRNEKGKVEYNLLLANYTQ